MRLTTGFLLVCVTCYAGTTSKCPVNTDAILETSTAKEVLGQVLEMLLGRLDDVDRKLLDLQVEMAEHREEVERNRATNEMTFVDFLWALHRLGEDVGRNMSVLQDRSLVILDQQKSCANHDRLRERLFDHIPKQNHSSYKTLEQTLLSFKSRIPAGVSSPTTSTTPRTTTTTQPTVTEPPIYASCKDAPANISGVYLIRINNDSAPFKVYCEMESYGGGWIVVQHRFNGSVDFYRNWADYRDGFGELDSEFWLGLEHIHQLTTARSHELMVEVKDFNGNSGNAYYSSFEIGSESEKYILKQVGSYIGTAGDSLKDHKGKMFSTKDQDNDESSVEHYAVTYEGPWWHVYSYSNLNGQYNNTTDTKSMFWYHLKNDWRGMSFSRMMIHEF
ncbi:tenascin-R-like [Anopheles aquasalis]|uniref:tenascin-R-like n=1 Tax=Anopheles aquasalis TaxID=42839 RepID=UPI00215A853F|nr:tenascin-R-like [Anopheles aquasalis]